MEPPHRSDIAAVLLRLGLTAVEMTLTHAWAKLYAAQAATRASVTVARAEQTKRTRFRNDVPGSSEFQFVPFATELHGYKGKQAVPL